MRIRRLIPALTILLFCAGPDVAHAQDDPMRMGIEAFREDRYEDAVRAFERAIEANPQNAEAYFLLARIYAETPLDDRKKAGELLDRAIEIEPQNVTYLVGRLQQLREESWNFLVEKIREQRRVELARKILAIDSTNAFAHEELGTLHIRDFWRYRNAIMMPSLRFEGTTYGMPDAITADGDPDLQQPGTDPTDPSDELVGPQSTGALTEIPGMDPNEVFLADRFDVERLEEIGVPVQNLAGRAQRAYERAIGHLKLALETDPRRRSVYDHLMEIYSLRGAYQDALEMLEDMYIFFADSPSTWLYLGLAHFRTGNLDPAAKSFETAFKYMSDEERMAFESLDYLLPKEEKSAFEQDPVAYASRYWTSKDPRYLTSYNERKLEHYARLVYADLLYGSPDLDLRGWDTQRGQILVRYGPPLKDVVLIPGSTSGVSSIGGLPTGHPVSSTPLEAGDMAYMGMESGGGGGSMDMLAEANAFNIWDYGDFRFVFEDPFRNGEYRLYSPSASEIAQGVPPWINDYSIRARETFAEIPERYEYEAPGRQIELPFLVNAFKGAEGKTDLYVHYGIPISQEGADLDMINVSANIGAFLIGEQRDILVERRRTIYGLDGTHLRSFDEAVLWVDTEEMDAIPGQHQVSMEFETASGSTVAVQRRDVEVPDFSGSSLIVSDVMLAYGIEEATEREAGPGVLRRNLSIDASPWSVFAVEQPIYLYFEIYNLGIGPDGRSDYEIEAHLNPKDDSGRIAGWVKNLFGGVDGVSVRLPGAGTATDEPHYLIMDATNQEPGLYTLSVRVRDNITGETTEREKELFLE